MNDSTDKRHQEHLLAWGLVILLSPVLILRALLGWVLTRTLVTPEQHCDAQGRKVGLRWFSGELPLRRLGGLFNVLNHDIQLTGYELRPCTKHSAEKSGSGEWRAGLFSPYKLKRNAGIAFDSETEVLERYYKNWTLLDSVKLMISSIISPQLSNANDQNIPKSLTFFGVKVNNSNTLEVLTSIRDVIAQKTQHAITFVNADCLNQAYIDGHYFGTLQHFERIYPNGIGARIAAKMLGSHIVESINGTDLFPLICQQAAQHGHRVFLFGAREGIADTVAQNMCARFPDLQIVGIQHGYLSEVQTKQLLDQINASKADILCVALGTPRQEEWIDQHRNKLKSNILIGLGDCFDFYADKVVRAPIWLRELGMEWVYRLYQEPARMWQRYILGNPLFLFRMWRLGKHRLHARNVTQYQTNRLINHILEFDRSSGHKSRFSRKLKRLLWLLTVESCLVLKRLIDILASGLGMIVLSPFLLVLAILIKTESKGALFYHQTRVGKYGREFKFWKFRSMYVDADQRQQQMMASSNEMTGGVIFKMKKDPRVTKIGYWIRKFSIDELPQLWNVFIGDMSLVGPRPALPSEVLEYDVKDRDRLAITPGITCIWQVSGRSDIPFDQQVELDRQYINSQSILNDVLILLKTVPAVITGKGAY